MTGRPVRRAGSDGVEPTLRKWVGSPDRTILSGGFSEALDRAIKTPEVKAHHDTIFNPVRNLGPEGSASDVVSQAEKWKVYFADKK